MHEVRFSDYAGALLSVESCIKFQPYDRVTIEGKAYVVAEVTFGVVNSEVVSYVRLQSD